MSTSHLLVLGGMIAAAASGRAEQDPENSWVEETLAQLSLREKVAQMVMPWIPGGNLGPAEMRRARQLVAQDRVGGILVGKGPAGGTVAVLNQLQELAPYPLLIAADLEWGAGTRLEGATVLPVNMALGALGSADYAYEAGRITALEARAAGIHFAFAPVADVNVNPSNPVINTRSYGADSDAVAAWVSGFIAGAQGAGLLTAVKHFPGHGDTDLDSHLALPTLSLARNRLDEVELVPFRAAIKAGVTAVMTAHVAVPTLEPMGRRIPATLSSPILTGLLREQLGYDGLIVTDALNMEGVRAGRTTGEIALQAVRAGADILLMPSNATAAIDAIVAVVEAGELSERRINASVRRILEAKAAVGLNERRTVDATRVASVLGAEAHQQWAQRAADGSMTLVRADGRLPLALWNRNVVSIAYDEGRARRLNEDFDRVLAERGAKVQTIRLSRSSSAAQLQAAARAARAADVVVFSSYVRPVAWRGRLGLPRAIATFADDLASNGAILISFGDPYLLDQIPKARTYLIAWSDAEVAQRAAARALTGQIAISGRLPIPLPPHHGLGEGIALANLLGAPVEAQEEAAGEAAESSQGNH